MSVFLGLTVSDDTMVECALVPYAQEMRLPTGEAGAWGLTYYSRGELLQRVNPQKTGEPLEIAQVVSGLRSDLILMHSRNPTVGTVRTENVHPFRFKDWSFAHNGTLGGFSSIKEDLCNAMPPFILRGIKGDTDSEHLFHLFLSFLFDAGSLGRPDPGIALIRDGLQRMVKTMDELASQQGHDPSACSFIVSDGYSLVAFSRGVPVDYMRVEGVEYCEVCRTSGGPLTGSGTGVHHPGLKTVLIRSDASNELPKVGFNRVKEESFLMVTRSQEVEFSAIV